MYLSFDSQILLLGIYTREIKTCLYKNSYVIVYSSFMHKCQKLKRILSTAVGEWLNCDIFITWNNNMQ